MARPKSDIEPRIVHAARQRFLADGVDGASLRGIARDAGTSIGMIYYYFPTKDDLFLAVVEEVYEKVLEDLAHLLSKPMTFAERMERVSVRVGAMSEHELEVFRLVIREALVSSSRLDRLIDRFKRGHVALMVQAVGEALARGTLDRSLHPVVLVMSAFALSAAPQMMRRIAADRLGWGELPDVEEFASQLVKVLFHGIGNKDPDQLVPPARPEKA